MSYAFFKHTNGSVSLIENGARFIEQLRRYLQFLYRDSPHYHALMEQFGQSPASPPLDTLGGLPHTTKRDYREILQLETLSRLNGLPFVCDYSSGSTNRCVLRLATPIDELGEQAVTEDVFRLAGMRRGDHFVCMEVGLPEIYDFYFRAARSLGVRRTTYLHLTQEFGRSLAPLAALAPNVLLTLPSVLVRAWPHLRNTWPPRQSPIRALIHMGEPMHRDFRREVSQTLGCRIYSFYGTTETGGVAGECRFASGGHFDPTKILPTIKNPKFLDNVTVEGELFLTTLYIKFQSVLKYRVGDIARLTTAPCPCGDPRPRLSTRERTHDSFVLTGVKFRYQTILEALKQVAPKLAYLTITLLDLSDKQGHALLQIDLPDEFLRYEQPFMETLKHGIFELDDAYHLGLVQFQLRFHDPTELECRKIRRVIDNRAYMNA